MLTLVMFLATIAFLVLFIFRQDLVEKCFFYVGIVLMPILILSLIFGDSTSEPANTTSTSKIITSVEGENYSLEKSREIQLNRESTNYYNYSYRPSVGKHFVNGYLRKDGTRVEGHYKTNRDDSFWNNWSSAGNTNPYTGTVGVKKPNSSESFGNSTYVNGYFKSDGTYVSGHYRQ